MFDFFSLKVNKAGVVSSYFSQSHSYCNCEIVGAKYHCLLYYENWSYNLAYALNVTRSFLIAVLVFFKYVGCFI